MRLWTTVIVSALLLAAVGARAEVTGVVITTRTVVAGGLAFGSTGPYEKLSGTVAFALDPADPRNARIVDLASAPRASDGRVHFTADLYVLQPVEAARGNGTLLFEIANRGRKGLLARFNRAPGSDDPTTVADLGDGFLMREGFTAVWVGWQFDVEPPLLRVQAPTANVAGRARFSFILDERSQTAAPSDWPAYLPTEPNDPTATLTVRDRFWQAPTSLARHTWRFATGSGRPRLTLDSGFEPGRVYEVDYPATGARVAGVGMAAIRDAASAFVHRQDLPIRGQRAYVFGISQSGRFLRQFLHDGFNVDERHRQVFAAVWPHIAGAGQGSFNERFAMPGYSSFPATRFPYTDLPQAGRRGGHDGILAAYQPAQRPKVLYTNTSVEYWGQGRAAALTHTSLDGAMDVGLPDHVRLYLLAGTQHGEAAFPPRPGAGQALGNPTPQANVMRALLRAMHLWVTRDVAPPASRYPRLKDGSLVPLAKVTVPNLSGVGDPRRIEGPGEIVDGAFAPLPFLVPQVDRDGNEIGGIRVAEVAVPLATTTGWNFRSNRVGNPTTLYPLLGSYLPFTRTTLERTTRSDPRQAIGERYRDRQDYLDRIRTATAALVSDRFILPEDVANVLLRATQHWDHAMGAPPSQTN